MAKRANQKQKKKVAKAIKQQVRRQEKKKENKKQAGSKNVNIRSFTRKIPAQTVTVRASTRRIK